MVLRFGHFLVFSFLMKLCICHKYIYVFCQLCSCSLSHPKRVTWWTLSASTHHTASRVTCLPSALVMCNLETCQSLSTSSSWRDRGGLNMPLLQCHVTARWVKGLFLPSAAKGLGLIRLRQRGRPSIRLRLHRLAHTPIDTWVWSDIDNGYKLPLLPPWWNIFWASLSAHLNNNF